MLLKREIKTFLKLKRFCLIIFSASAKVPASLIFDDHKNRVCLIFFLMPYKVLICASKNIVINFI